MKRGSNRLQLDAVLDSSDLNGESDQLIDDERIEQLATEQEASRKAFDAVLTHANAHWSSVSDPAELREALVTVLQHIRGASTGHDQQNHQAPAAAAAAAAATATAATAAADDNQPPADHADSPDTHMDDYKHASDTPVRPSNAAPTTNPFPTRAKYIPLRLSQPERKLLRLVEAALNVSEYTDVVDIVSHRSKPRQRIYTQIRDLCSILTGLTVASDYNEGKKLVADRDFADNEVFFQTAFEIARRHKVANPEKSRDTYGKLIHMLQDAAQDEIVRLLDFSCVKPLVTVASYLEERNGIDLLDDPLMHTATREIIADGKPRRAVQREIAEKERAVALLARKYGTTRGLDEDGIRRCLYSIGDNNAYLRAARDPCDDMIKFLHLYFKPERPADRGSSLAITSGTGGARLTHDHNRQFRYVFQSLALWREVCHDMYRLWYLSEMDLLNAKNRYSLRNTGQGLNRVQAAPSVSRAMSEILETVQRRVGSWVGSSVVHLGDYNVPNALVFIDKYAQVQRILGPLCTSIRRIGEVAKDDASISKYIGDTFGGVEAARKLILRDFFRHAFDGSGASDWFSAGSCIDGRLTSAWNWCSEIERKPYWSLFLLTGFTGFDGDF